MVKKCDDKYCGNNPDCVLGEDHPNLCESCFLEFVDSMDVDEIMETHAVALKMYKLIETYKELAMMPVDPTEIVYAIATTDNVIDARDLIIENWTEKINQLLKYKLGDD